MGNFNIKDCWLNVINYKFYPFIIFSFTATCISTRSLCQLIWIMLVVFQYSATISTIPYQEISMASKISQDILWMAWIFLAHSLYRITQIFSQSLLFLGQVLWCFSCWISTTMAGPDPRENGPNLVSCSRWFMEQKCLEFDKADCLFRYTWKNIGHGITLSLHYLWERAKCVLTCACHIFCLQSWVFLCYLFNIFYL